MSLRTIAEFNHDLVHRIQAEPEEFARLLARYLTSHSHDAWDDLRARYGVNILARIHHTDKVTISFGHGG